MELDQINQSIIEHWIRHVLKADFFIMDLILMIVEFAKLHEKFDKKLSHKDLFIADDGLSGRSDSGIDWMYNWKTLVGIYVAKPGGRYVWKIKLTEGKYIGIGIVSNEAVESELKEYWWGKKQGYIWYAKTGTTNFAPGNKIAYGCNSVENDEITMSLDLNKYEISYMINDKDLGVVDVEIGKDTDYRLAVGCYGTNAPNSVELLSLDIYVK